MGKFKFERLVSAALLVVCAMANFTFSVMVELFYHSCFNYVYFSQYIRIILAVLYSLILVSSAFLNGILLYVFLTTPKLRKPSKFMVSTLLWNSTILAFAVFPISFLEVSMEGVRRNRDVIATRSYLTMFYIWLSFTTVMLIGMTRVQKIKRKSIRVNHQKYWSQIILYVAAGVVSAGIPFIKFTIHVFYGIKASFIFVAVALCSLTVILLASYSLIISTVKRSRDIHGDSVEERHSTRRNKKTLAKVKNTTLLVMGCYILTLVPFLCDCAIEIYVYYHQTIDNDRASLLHLYRAVSELVLFLNAIFNPIVYFYTQTDFKSEVIQLSIVRNISSRLQYLRMSSSSTE